MCKVFNKHHRNAPKEAVYVGRPTVYGNPFSHLPNTLACYQVHDRDDEVDAYAAWVVKQPELMTKIRTELKGKDLVCWCAPARCHADVLLRLANHSS